MLMRAVTSPATTSTPGWAAEIVGQSNYAEGPFSALAPSAIFARMTERAAYRLSFGSASGSIRIPWRTESKHIAGDFVGEGAEIPVRSGALSSTTIEPYTLGVISFFTGELASRSTPSIESVITAIVEEDTRNTIDAKLLDSQPQTAIRPAGLRYGIAPLPASVAPDPLAALTQDISNLVKGIVTSPMLGLIRPLLITDSASEMRIRLIAPTGALGLDSHQRPLDACRYDFSCRLRRLHFGERRQVRRGFSARRRRFTPTTYRCRSSAPGNPPAQPTYSLYQHALVGQPGYGKLGHAARKPGEFRSRT